MCANTGLCATFNSPCAGFIPMVSLLYRYNRSFVWNSVRYRESGCNSICQNALLKSILEKNLHPANFALTASCLGIGSLVDSMALLTLRVSNVTRIAPSGLGASTTLEI